MQIKLEKPVYGGECLGHLPEAGGKPGKAVFVPLTLPGELIEAQVVEEKRGFARAEAMSLVQPSPERVAPHCAHFGACGGCHYQHAEGRTQLEFKEQILREALERAGVAAPKKIDRLAGEPWAYRNRVRMALTCEGRLAYRGRRSHDLVPIRMCPIAAPILTDTAERASAFIQANAGLLPVTEVELFTNQNQTQLLVTLFVQDSASAPQAAVEAWLGALHTALPDEVVGLRLQVQDGGLQPAIVAAYGESSLNYTAGGVPYRVDHGAFFQVNRWLVDDFVTLVVGQVAEPGLAWDLYAGVGLFARQLADRGAEVHAVEAAPASLGALRNNLAGKRAQAVASTTLDYLRGNRERREARPDLILLDPPRAGLGAEVTQLLNAIHAPEMVYVSCDPLTLARDLRALTLERYRIEALTLVDMFPQTFHIETVVRLRRT
jgi:23S rRNA (uracil1939-C5)-methyltransferase